jgi:membrane-associated phospholipid phosphatase
MTEPDKTAAALDSALDTNAVEKADVTLAVQAGQFRGNPVVKAAGTASEVADQPPMLALSAATLGLGLAVGDRRLAATGGRMLAGVALTTAVKGAIKLLIARTRPSKALEDGRYEARLLGPNEGPWNSFPSGHTANAVAVARAVARAYPGARAPAYAAAAAAALIQVPRGAHYPIDVAAGALIGWASEAAVDAAARRLGVEP